MDLFTFVFLHYFNFRANLTIFVWHFWKIYSLTLLLIWLKELLLHKGSVKMENISACSEHCTVQMADPVVMQES